MKRENLKIAEPCTEIFESMDPTDGAARFCEQCTKNVHNLSEMTREEAREFLEANKESNLCVVYKYDARSEEVLFRKTAASARQLAGLKRLLAAAAMVPMLAGCEIAEEPCVTDSSEVRPIDLILEQESHFMEFFSQLFGPDEPQIMGEIAVEFEDPHESEIVVEPVLEEIEPEHELREELDLETKPPIRRLMGKIAPTQYEPELEIEPIDERAPVKEIMGDVVVEY